jgi:hypothetical protein
MTAGAIALLLVSSLPPLTITRWHLPVTIAVTQDVEVKPTGVSREARGTLYIGRDEKAFRIKNGQAFQMIRIGSEGGCRIQFRRKNYELVSCPWLDGFRDHQADIFKVVAKKGHVAAVASYYFRFGSTVIMRDGLPVPFRCEVTLLRADDQPWLLDGDLQRVALAIGERRLKSQGVLPA